MNTIDPDGRWAFFDDAVAIGIGAVAGGITGCLKGHCDVTSGKFWAYVGAGAAIGEASLYTGGAAATWATGATGLATGSGVAAAVAGGAAAGAVSGGLSGAGMYLTSSAVGDNKFSWSGLAKQTGMGIASGAVIGGAVGGISYGLSDGVQWQTHKTVLEYADRQNNPDAMVNAAKYVNNVEGGDDETFFAFSNNKTGASNYEYQSDVVTLDQHDFVYDGEFQADRFYSTTAHEIQHESLFKMGGSYESWSNMNSIDMSNAIGSQEHIIGGRMMNHAYNNYWTVSDQDNIRRIYEGTSSYIHPFYRGL